ncbi:hypothetical protein OK074_8849 [Actinobacteria bacterium OK074]|nr:hypothetical protein OK074_8849 [Actinobacteria bacterium OK074]
MSKRIPPPGAGRTLVQLQSAGVLLACLQYVLALVLLPQNPQSQQPPRPLTPRHPQGHHQGRAPRGALAWVRACLRRLSAPVATVPARGAFPAAASADGTATSTNTPLCGLGWGVGAPPLPGAVRTVGPARAEVTA